MVAVLLVGSVAFYLYLFWAAQRNSSIVLTDVLTGDNGRLVSSKVIQFLAFHGTFWAMVFMTVTGKATVAEWTLFWGTCAGLALGNKAVNNAAAAKANELSAATGVPPPITSDKS